MRVMRGPWADWPSSDVESSVTIGVFDGVHKGHRALIDHLDDRFEKTVLTFDPHPVEVLRAGTPPRLITTIEERLELLEGAGVARVGVLDLGEIKDLSPGEFVAEVLVERYGTRHVVLGPDFRFGKDRAGDVASLRRLGDHLGLTVEVVGLVGDEVGPISSSRIRLMIEDGKPARAAAQMTTRFRVTGPVVHGDQRGAAIGFPTANLIPPERKVVPATGVYAAYAHLGHATERAAVNVGVRPTFGGGDLLIEAYIMDFDAEIYGEDLTIEFVEYLRPELDFDSVGDLVSQMGRDVEQSSMLLESTTSNVG